MMAAEPIVSTLDHALEAAKLGLHVFPVYALKADGSCQCGDAGCASPAKHPRISGWQKEASTDPGHIKAWWSRWPGANLGVALQAGQCVLDIDPRKGGDDTLAELEKDFGPARPTWEDLTGGGGAHLFFTGDLPNTAGKLGPGLDTRGLGGFVVGPGSLHVSGRRYTWCSDGHPEEVPLAPLPGWIAGLLAQEETVVPGGPVPEGIAIKAFEWALRRAKHGKPRNETGFNLACQLRDNGVAIADAEPLMRQYASEVAGAGDHPYTPEEALHSLRQAYQRPPREPWPVSPVVRIGGGSARPVGVPALVPRQLSDLGNAERFADDHGGKVLFVHDWGQWLIWDGKCWGRDEDGGAIRLAKETARQIWEEVPRATDSDQKRAVTMHALKSESAGKLEAMLSLAKAETAIATTPKSLDVDRWVLNCENGILDLATGVLGPHDPEKRCTRQVPAPYLPGAACPRWEAFLVRVVTPDVADFLRRAIGYALTGSVQEQCLFVLYGTGANGKSVFLETLRALWGTYGEQAEPKSFIERKTDQISNDLARLKGARLVVATETEQGARMAEALVKQVTGGEAIVARFLRQEFFTFYPEFKLFLATNSKPSIRGTDNGIWRRIRLVPWEVTIPSEERDQGLGVKLREELPGILAWAVRGCLEWQKGGLNPPARVLAATDDYRSEMDSIGGFVDEECERAPRWTVPFSALYREYVQWAERCCEKPISRRAFSMSLQERGFRIVREGHDRSKSVAGLKLRTDADRSTYNPIETPNSKSNSVNGPHASACSHPRFSRRSGQVVCSDCGVTL